MPMFLRKFIVDFIETGAGALLAFTFVFPATFDDTKKIAVAAGAALVAAAISAARRNAGAFYLWVRGVLGVPPEA